MQRNTATQTGATLFLGVLMTAALVVLQQVGLPPLTAAVPPARASDSYNVLRVPLDLADLVADAGGKNRTTPPREVAADAETAMGPASLATGSTPPSLAPADGPATRRAEARAPESDPPATSRPQPERSAPVIRDGGNKVQPSPERKHSKQQTRSRGRSDSEQLPKGRSRVTVSASSNGSKVGRVTRDKPQPDRVAGPRADKPQVDRRLARRDDKIKAAALLRDRSARSPRTSNDRQRVRPRPGARARG